jgi:phosphate/sulfate permease
MRISAATAPAAQQHPTTIHRAMRIAAILNCLGAMLAGQALATLQNAPPASTAAAVALKVPSRQPQSSN